jgi:hypothetical protein
MKPLLLYRNQVMCGCQDIGLPCRDDMRGIPADGSARLITEQHGAARDGSMRTGVGVITEEGGKDTAITVVTTIVVTDTVMTMTTKPVTP